MVKRVKDIIAPHLCKLFNSCISTGTFPLCLKLGKITPIHKKGPKNDISNYGPVSTLPIFGKIFEKIIYDRLFSFVTERRILSNTQFGFRKKYSTSHAINYSVNLIKQFQLKGKNIIGIFIDLSKAFDTINYTSLLTKLEPYGIRGIPYNLIKSYPSDRYQAVNIDGTLSEREAVQYGVPQGSVLGPLLFLIYMNDLQNYFTSPNVKFVLYVDDTNIFVACNTVEEGILLANKVLSNVRAYMLCNLLNVNLDKSCFMHFPSSSSSGRNIFKDKNENYTTKTGLSKSKVSNNNLNRKLLISDSQLSEVDNVKFLGVTFDRGLSWDKHTENLYKRLKCAIAVIKRIKPCINEENFKTLYYTLFESHLLYGISAWGGICHTRLEKVFRLPKKCIRVFFGDLDRYMEKFCTCARTRPYENQVLASEFYMKEHTKPIFNEKRY